MGRRFGLIGLLISLGVAGILRFSNRHSTGEEYLAASIDLVSEIPSHRAHAEYVDWLVTQAHDQCFDASYTQDFGRRGRGGKIHVDEYGYLNDLFASMIHQAESDKQPAIVSELTALRHEVFADDESD
jgi:hypothetical protein